MNLCVLYVGIVVMLIWEILFYVIGFMIYENLKKGVVVFKGGCEFENY